MTALIITGGTVKDAFIQSYLREHSFDLIFAVDRGMEFFYQNHIVPDLLVGDFDSVSPAALTYFQHNLGIEVLHFAPEKDETDTELALRTAICRGVSEIHLLGATGTRIDHLLGNIHLLGMALAHQVSCVMADSCNRIRLLNRGICLKRSEQYGKYVSLIPFTPEVKGLTLTGFQYPLLDYRLESCHSIGISNEIVEEQAKISFQEGILILIESRDPEEKTDHREEEK